LYPCMRSGCGPVLVWTIIHSHPANIAQHGSIARSRLPGKFLRGKSYLVRRKMQRSKIPFTMFLLYLIKWLAAPRMCTYIRTYEHPYKCFVDVKCTSTHSTLSNMKKRNFNYFLQNVSASVTSDTCLN